MTDAAVLDKKQCKIYACEFNDIRKIFAKYHYKKAHMGGGISKCFAMFIGFDMVGGAVLGLPRHESAYANYIDIRRMACIDSSPKNSESWFLGQIIKWVIKNTNYTGVLSYSDLSVGHAGGIYKAANFMQIGETLPTKWVEWSGKQYHPRSLSIDRDYSYKMRKAVETGEAKIITGLPKKIWVYKIERNPRSEKRIKSIEIEMVQQDLFGNII
jgi:hypothetical protein